MLENKKRNQQRESGDSKRLKSGAGDKHPHEEEEETVKPQSSLRMRRPVSAFKAAESTNSIATATTLKPDIDPKPIITTAFDHGAKLQEFLRENKLESEKYHDWLISNELFLLAALSRLKETQEDKHAIVIEKECIAKIRRELQVR